MSLTYIKCTKCGTEWNLLLPTVNATCWNGEQCTFELKTRLLESSIPESSPPVMQKIGHFSAALIKHIRNKGKTRTEDEVIELYDNFCSQCEFFSNNSCLKCGCKIVKDNSYRNKLKWESEHCPIDKW